MRISDWSSDVCSSDLGGGLRRRRIQQLFETQRLFARRDTADQAVDHLILKHHAAQTLQHLGARAVIGLDLFRLLVIGGDAIQRRRSEEHTSELQSLMRISYAVFCLKKKKNIQKSETDNNHKSNKT